MHGSDGGRAAGRQRHVLYACTFCMAAMIAAARRQAEAALQIPDPARLGSIAIIRAL